MVSRAGALRPLTMSGGCRVVGRRPTTSFHVWLRRPTHRRHSFEWLYAPASPCNRQFSRRRPPVTFDLGPEAGEVHDYATIRSCAFSPLDKNRLVSPTWSCGNRSHKRGVWGYRVGCVDTRRAARTSRSTDTYDPVFSSSSGEARRDPRLFVTYQFTLPSSAALVSSQPAMSCAASPFSTAAFWRLALIGSGRNALAGCLAAPNNRCAATIYLMWV